MIFYIDSKNIKIYNFNIKGPNSIGSGTDFDHGGMDGTDFDPGCGSHFLLTQAPYQRGLHTENHYQRSFR